MWVDKMVPIKFTLMTWPPLLLVIFLPNNLWGILPKEEATCAMLLAKILWDLQLGGDELAHAVRMLRPSLGRET